MALISENTNYCAELRTLLLARSHPLVTVHCRLLGHAGCT